jgi:perosamine synthetase
MEDPMTDSGFLPFHSPDAGDEEIAQVAEAIKSGWLTTGPKTKEFERGFAGFVGARHVVALNSATAAIHLALEAIRLKEGDEVIVPTMTFASTAEVVFYRKAKPVLADCRRETMNLEPADLERKITPRTRAVIPVHMAGEPCEMEAILAIARARGLTVIEDAAHALPSKLRMPAGGPWRTVGSIGDMTCFSFYATKTLTTGEGGMLVTENEEWADRARMLSLHGISRDAWKRYTAEGSWYYEILEPGFKYNMTDIAAAIGLAQLKKCDAMWAKRVAYAERYTQAFRNMPEIGLPARNPEAQHAWHLYVIILNLEQLTIDRAEFIERLRETGIGTSVHFIPLHLHPFYRDTFGYRREDFPNASYLYDRIISLPIYSKMTEGDVNRVIEAVATIVGRFRR